MTISELVEELLKLSEEFGDLEVKYSSPCQPGDYTIEGAYAIENTRTSEVFAQLDWS
jgi:hypothetical protein